MVNESGPVPPQGHGQKKIDEDVKAKPVKNTGSFHFQEGKEFLGMHFTAKQWNKLMDIMVRNMGDYINRTFQKMKEKLKKDWKRGRGELVD